jgi:hypothetical protein
MRSSRFLTAICDDIDPWKHTNRGHMSAGVAMVGQPYCDALSDILALTVALNSRSLVETLMETDTSESTKLMV